MTVTCESPCVSAFDVRSIQIIRLGYIAQRRRLRLSQRQTVFALPVHIHVESTGTTGVDLLGCWTLDGGTLWIKTCQKRSHQMVAGGEQNAREDPGAGYNVADVMVSAE